jgi:hypothetical protein
MRDCFLYARHESVWSNERIAPLILYLGRDGVGRLTPSKQHAVCTEWGSGWVASRAGRHAKRRGKPFGWHKAFSIPCYRIQNGCGLNIHPFWYIRNVQRITTAQNSNECNVFLTRRLLDSEDGSTRKQHRRTRETPEAPLWHL